MPLLDGRQLLEGRATGLLEVIKQLFDIRQGGLYGVGRSIQPVMEARAIRPWEYVLEGIRPFGRRTSVGAIPGEFSGVAIGVAASQPRGTLVVITRVRCRAGAANSAGVRISTRSVMEATYATAVTTAPLDGRIGTQTDPAVEIITGSDPALQGPDVSELNDDVAGTKGDYITPIVLAYQREQAGATDLFVNVQGTVVNQPLVGVEFSGLVIVPRA
jgi:hypothetical protein